LAGGGFDDACRAFHERGFTCAVVTGEGDALAGLDGEGKVVEEDAGAELNAQ
jgi:hypothetical protein